LFELRVFDFHWRRASAQSVIERIQPPDHRELAQARADRSKTTKVIFRQINMFEPSSDAGLGR